jgi:cell division transport system permease protein
VQTGFANFWRNGFVTIASVLVMTVTMFVLGSLIFVNAMLNASITQLEKKVDVNVYFTTSATENQILDLKESLEEKPEVASVEYVPRKQALQNFRQRHEGDQLILQALEELNENPLGAHLNVQAQDPSQYESIANYIQSGNALGGDSSQIVDKVNYYQNQAAIQRLTNIIDSIDGLSLATLAVFMVISILIIFNTIRLGIYTARDEISVMKLVGASNSYIRGPFVIEGSMYGIVGGLVALGLLYPLTLWIGPFTEQFFGATNAFDYYVNNFAELFLALVFAGALIGALSSFLAVKKYLKV